MESSDTYICPSQYFANKQNVRSYRNIQQQNFVKTEDGTKLYQSSLVSDNIQTNQQDLQEILVRVDNNLKEEYKKDFKNYFTCTRSKDFLQPVDKKMVESGCHDLIRKVIPKEYYGHYSNMRILKNFTHSIVFTMKGEHINLKKVTKLWNFSQTPWKDLSDAQGILECSLTWILKYVIAPAIMLNFHVTTTKIDFDEYKLTFYWKNEWQKFYDQSLYRLEMTKVITKSLSHSYGRVVRKGLCPREKVRRRKMKNEVPQIVLYLKPNNEYRPIVRYKHEASKEDKKKVKDKLYLLKMLAKRPVKKFESQYHQLHKLWKEMSEPKLYFIKTDLTNAFGSIEKDKLMRIVAERHMKFQNNEKSVELKKKIAKLYSEAITELRHPFLVRAGSTVYKWNKGLVQGYKLSPALSEIYYDQMDKLVFGEFLHTVPARIKFFTRSVDDYLFVTDSLEVAKGFLKCLSKYKNVNYAKTVANFCSENVKYSKEISFLGYSYNTENLHVSRARNVFSGQMCYKIVFSNAVSNLSKFLENRIGQSGIHITGHLFNFFYNTEELVWNHIFTTFCLSSNKFCTILAIICDATEMCKYLELYKQRVVVKLGNAIIETLCENKPVPFVFRFCINHVRYLAWKALLLCCKNTPVCSGLVPLVNDALAKSNCIFGKWREHFMRVDVHGNCQTTAVKEICRRTDLRAILKNFDTPPHFYTFYNAKYRL